MHELDLRLDADAVHRADQIGHEHEGALQDGDDEQIGRRRGAAMACAISSLRRAIVASS
jgi:hypothetical protein